jgi:capsular exopolysaccharide synthesis family protein
VSKFRNALDVNLANKQTSVVNLSIRDVSTQRAEDVLNTVIAIYNEEAVNDKNTMAINTENFINERLIIIEKELGNVDNLITQYKTEHQLTDIQSDAQLALQESSKSDFEAQRLRNQRSMASYVRTYLADPAKSAELIPSNTGIEDINVETQIMTYNQSLLKRDRLMESSSERNPVVQDINNSLNSLRQSIIRTVDNLIVNLDIQIKSVDARNQRTRARISAVPRQEKDVTSISRQQQIKAQLYLYLLNKREENALNKAITESTARIIDAANGVSGPVAPRVMIIILAALIIGIAIPALIIYFIMVSDIMVRNRKDLVSALSIPFLGEVPYKKPKKNATSDYIAVREHGRDPVSEAFRIIRTNVDFMRVKQEHIRVIALTSYFPGSGKTFVAYNLAVSLAMTGKKVLLVDMDTRKGTLGKTIGKDSFEYKGLTSFLSRTVEDINLIINQDVNYPDIDIIYSGPQPPNPAELLLSTRLDSLFDDLRGMYDFIVTDNVPSGMVADAVIANRISDLTLYVVRAGKMDRRLLPEIEQLYTDEKLRNMAVILNAVNTEKGYGYGRYGYGYGY